MEEAGDPYRDQMEDCIYLIMQELKARGVNNDHTLAYQVGHTVLSEFLCLQKSQLVCSITLSGHFRFFICATLSEPSWTSAMVEALY